MFKVVPHEILICVQSVALCSKCCSRVFFLFYYWHDQICISCETEGQNKIFWYSWETKKRLYLKFSDVDGFLDDQLGDSV